MALQACLDCGTAVSDQASACPKCGRRPEQPRRVSVRLGLGLFFFPWVFSWLLLRKGYGRTARIAGFTWGVVALVLMVIGQLAPKPDLPAKVAAAESPAPAPSAPVEERPELGQPELGRPKPGAEVPRYGLDERFTLGGFAYVVKKVAKGKRIAGQAASDGAIFFVVEYTIENLGKATDTALTDDLTVVDAAGRQFRSSTEANTALLFSSGKKDLMLSELQPGIPRPMKTAFELPLTAVSQGFKLVIPEKGLLGQRTAEIHFSPIARE